jgi:hypothetical protein
MAPSPTSRRGLVLEGSGNEGPARLPFGTWGSSSRSRDRRCHNAPLPQGDKELGHAPLVPLGSAWHLKLR